MTDKGRTLTARLLEKLVAGTGTSDPRIAVEHQELLQSILLELKKIETHLSLITDTEIKEEDISQ